MDGESSEADIHLPEDEEDESSSGGGSDDEESEEESEFEESAPKANKNKSKGNKKVR